MKILFSSILILFSLNILVSSTSSNEAFLQTAEKQIDPSKEDEMVFLFYLYSLDEYKLRKMAENVHDFYTKKNWDITLEKSKEKIKAFDKEHLISWINIQNGRHPEYYNLDKFLKEIAMPMNIPLFFSFAQPKITIDAKFLEELVTKTEETLKNYCLAIDQYERKDKGIDITEEISDIINLQQRNDLLDYIRAMSTKYIELASFKFLDSLVTKYVSVPKVLENLLFIEN